jgi:hypothetical protein
MDAVGALALRRVLADFRSRKPFGFRYAAILPGEDLAQSGGRCPDLRHAAAFSGWPAASYPWASQRDISATRS